MVAASQQWSDISDPPSDVQAWKASVADTSLHNDIYSEVMSLSDDSDTDETSLAQKNAPITPPRVFNVSMSRTLENRSASLLRDRGLLTQRPLIPPFIKPDFGTCPVESWASTISANASHGLCRAEKDATPETFVSNPSHAVVKQASETRTESAMPVVKTLVKFALSLSIGLILFTSAIISINNKFFLTERLCSVSYLQSTSFCVGKSLQQRNNNTQTAVQVDFPAVMQIQDRAFATLSDSASGLANLAPEIREARLATNDLAILVKLSGLGNKVRLASLLEEFSYDAKKAARGMNRFHAQLGTAIDRVSVASDYALRTLRQAEKSPMKYLPAVFKPHSHDEALIASFELTCSTLAANLKRLINTAESLWGQLESLRLRLDTIFEVVSQERNDIAIDREKLLASLWTSLGQNQGRLSQFKRNLKLLLDLENFRSEALKHVVDALEALAQFSDELEELSKRVATPELAGRKLPLHVQLESIRKGVERLDRSRRTKLLPEHAVSNSLEERQKPV